MKKGKGLISCKQAACNSKQQCVITSHDNRKEKIKDYEQTGLRKV
jgi:hypothetical protein